MSRMLSVRLDERAEKELNYIKMTLNEGQTLAVKEAIHALYEILVTENKKSSAEMFMDSGYIGSFKAEKDLSVNYKERLTKDLKKKHGTK